VPRLTIFGGLVIIGTIGSKEGVLSHIISCSNPNDPKTCSYEYPLNGIKYTYNPCTTIGMVYDFDKEICVDPQTSSASNFDNVCQTYQVYDAVTGKSRCEPISSKYTTK
jgi:hypothetical protein